MNIVRIALLFFFSTFEMSIEKHRLWWELSKRHNRCSAVVVVPGTVFQPHLCDHLTIDNQCLASLSFIFILWKVMQKQDMCMCKVIVTLAFQYSPLYSLM